MKDFGFIYFIYDFLTKQTKIGKTANHPTHFLQELQASSSLKFELLHFYESAMVSQEVEKLHSLYDEYRIEDGWFELSLATLLEITHQTEEAIHPTLETAKTPSKADSSYVGLSPIPEKSESKSRTLASLPEEVQKLIVENAPNTMSVSNKVGRGKASYKCYASSKKYLGKIKGYSGSRYWEANPEQFEEKTAFLGDFGKASISKVKSFFSPSKKKRGTYSSTSA